MTTLESLNGMFKQVNELYVEQRKQLNEYLDKALELKGGMIELTGYYEDYDQAEEHDVEFKEQFPACVTVYDKHGFHHEILVTKLYKKGNLFYVNVYDYTNGEWTTGWYTDDLNDTLDSLARFVNFVLNPQEDETGDKQEAEETNKSFTSQVIGWQIVDEEQNYPSEFGCWDMFRTKEDADAYIADNLDPDEYHAVEEWSTSDTKASMYNIYEINERTFKEGEKMCVRDENNERFVFVLQDTSVRWINDVVTVKEFRSGQWIKNWVRAGKLYHLVDEKTHAETGLPSYIKYIDEKNHTYYCPDQEV